MTRAAPRTAPSTRARNAPACCHDVAITDDRWKFRNDLSTVQAVPNRLFEPAEARDGDDIYETSASGLDRIPDRTNAGPDFKYLL